MKQPIIIAIVLVVALVSCKKTEVSKGSEKSKYTAVSPMEEKSANRIAYQEITVRRVDKADDKTVQIAATEGTNSVPTIVILEVGGGKPFKKVQVNDTLLVSGERIKAPATNPVTANTSLIHATEWTVLNNKNAMPGEPMVNLNAPRGLLCFPKSVTWNNDKTIAYIITSEPNTVCIASDPALLTLIRQNNISPNEMIFFQINHTNGGEKPKNNDEAEIAKKVSGSSTQFYEIQKYTIQKKAGTKK